MLSLASILNPSPPKEPTGSNLYSPPRSSSPEVQFSESSSNPSRRPMVETDRLRKDLIPLPKSKVKGAVKFFPFEDLDAAALREIRRFRVAPFGSIRNNCRHIPYNSGKKDFFEKTARDSFEVFQYTFKLPGEELEYTVMWDYNVGLVRMTPFFKCCNYPKTTPAKMLNMNPGLRHITHSITGGSIMAQGYWMPFSCAKAVCATFCHHIAGALIPIFGPGFPAECVHPDASDHGKMCIDRAVVAEATVEAEGFRRLYAEQQSMTNPPSPRHQHYFQTSGYQEHLRPSYNGDSAYQSRPRFGRGQFPNSPYETETDEHEGFSSSDAEPGGPGYRPFVHIQHPYTPGSTPRADRTEPSSISTGWTAANHEWRRQGYQTPDRHVLDTTSRSRERDEQGEEASPFLTALPRLPVDNPQATPSQPRHYLPASRPRYGTGPHFTSLAAPPTPVMSPKRPRTVFAFENSAGLHHINGKTHVDRTSLTTSVGRESEGDYKLHCHKYSRSALKLLPIGESLTREDAEQNAAWLLLNLSRPASHDDGSAQQEQGDKDRDRKPARSYPWTFALDGTTRELESGRDDRPTRKRRRTISI